MLPSESNSGGIATQQQQFAELEESPVCPVCAEGLDDTDLALLPCPCDYQICLWCLQRIRERENNKCPQCRREYNDAQYRRLPLTHVMRAKKLHSKQQEHRSHDSGGGGEESNKPVAKNPTICRLFGCPPHLLSAQLLRQFRYLGKYGKILSIVVLNTKQSEVAFVTYNQEDQAQLACQDVFKLASKTPDPAYKSMRIQIGAARHCIQSLRGIPCLNEGCPFIHCQVDTDQPRSFCKLGKTKNGQWNKVIRPDLPLGSIVLDAAKESLFGKTLADLHTTYPALDITQAAVLAEQREIAASVPNPREPTSQAQDSEDIPTTIAAEGTVPKPKRAWQKLKNPVHAGVEGSCEDDDTVFPALNTFHSSKPQQSQQLHMSTATDSTAASSATVSVVFISPPPNLPRDPSNWLEEDFNTAKEPRTLSQKGQINSRLPIIAPPSPPLIATGGAKREAMQVPRVTSSSVGIKVFAPPTTIAPAEVTREKPAKAQQEGLPWPKTSVFGWDSDFPDEGPSQCDEESWLDSLLNETGSAGPGHNSRKSMSRFYSHDKESFISSRDFDLHTHSSDGLATTSQKYGPAIFKPHIDYCDDRLRYAPSQQEGVGMMAQAAYLSACPPRNLGTQHVEYSAFLSGASIQPGPLPQQQSAIPRSSQRLINSAVRDGSLFKGYGDEKYNYTPPPPPTSQYQRYQQTAASKKSQGQSYSPISSNPPFTPTSANADVQRQDITLDLLRSVIPNARISFANTHHNSRG